MPTLFSDYENCSLHKSTNLALVLNILCGPQHILMFHIWPASEKYCTWLLYRTSIIFFLAVLRLSLFVNLSLALHSQFRPLVQTLWCSPTVRSPRSFFATLSLERVQVPPPPPSGVCLKTYGTIPNFGE